jgi:ribosomal protein S18 acetylase RimI-like enzyme
MSDLIIREVRPSDLQRIVEIEAICFPAAEAAPLASFKERIAAFPESFFVAELGQQLIGFINGCATNSPVIYDELFYNSSNHLPDGENLAIFGLDVILEFRRQGIAAQLMKHFIAAAKDMGKRKVILTCKKQLIHYYETFGFVNDGLSKSTHGQSEWFDMILEL